MSYEILVGLNVIDDLKYNDYREAMKPILSSYGGRFCYDFEVSAVLISEDRSDINRVFTLNFNDQNSMENFFSDKEYLAVKEKYFVESVSGTTIISRYEK